MGGVNTLCPNTRIEDSAVMRVTWMVFMSSKGYAAKVHNVPWRGKSKRIAKTSPTFS